MSRNTVYSIAIGPWYFACLASAVACLSGTIRLSVFIGYQIVLNETINSLSPGEILETYKNRKKNFVSDGNIILFETVFGSENNKFIL